MIQYSTGTWGLLFIFTCHGSVFPKAMMWALPAACFCYVINQMYRENLKEEFEQVSEASVALTLLASYNAVLGFLTVFRSQLAYARWWEGGTLLQQLRGEWFNAFSSLIAFCTTKEELREQVEIFQQLLVRLMSLLYGCALQQVATMEKTNFDIFDLDGLDREHLMFLKESVDKCEITLQWIQRLVVQHSSAGTIEIAPPILSRVFQELSRGIVNLNNARKIKDFPFPFPWPQLITVMLMIQVLVTPIMAGLGIKSVGVACSVTFLVVFASFGVHYIAQELENPYGEDTNDLPLREMQIDMNKSLSRLLEPEAQSPPKFNFYKRASESNVRNTSTNSIMFEGIKGSGSQLQMCVQHCRSCCCLLRRQKRGLLHLRSQSDNTAISASIATASSSMHMASEDSNIGAPKVHSQQSAEALSVNQASSIVIPEGLPNERSDNITLPMASQALSYKGVAQPSLEVLRRPPVGEKQRPRNPSPEWADGLLAEIVDTSVLAEGTVTAQAPFPRRCLSRTTSGVLLTSGVAKPTHCRVGGQQKTDDIIMDMGLAHDRIADLHMQLQEEVKLVAELWATLRSMPVEQYIV